MTPCEQYRSSPHEYRSAVGDPAPNIGAGQLDGGRRPERKERSSIPMIGIPCGSKATRVPGGDGRQATVPIGAIAWEKLYSTTSHIFHCIEDRLRAAALNYARTP